MNIETPRAVLVTDAVGKTYALPSALAAHLCDYQIAGMQWLFGAVHGAHRPGCFGGILGDGTGLGKTIQTVALVGTLVKHQLAARILIIVPVTLVPVWAEQFSTHMAEGARPACRRRRRR
jgi:SNF2 family DNA or RNA helicase